VVGVDDVVADLEVLTRNDFDVEIGVGRLFC